MCIVKQRYNHLTTIRFCCKCYLLLNSIIKFVLWWLLSLVLLTGRCLAADAAMADHSNDISEIPVDSDDTGLPEQDYRSAGSRQDDQYQDNDDGMDDEDLGYTMPEPDITRVVDRRNPCDRSGDEYNFERTWYDETQLYINSGFCEPALWLDNFFAEDRIFEEGVPGTYVRLRTEFTYDEETHFDSKIGLNASIELPGLEHRARLTFSDDEEDEELQDVAPDGSSTSSGVVGLQLDITENARSKVSLSATLSPRVRLRYRYTYPATDTIILRFTQDIQRRKEVDSARTQFDFEKVLSEALLFRSSTEGKVSEEYDGVDWIQALVMYQRLNRKTSLSYESSVSGITEPSWSATNYRLGIRFRKNFHRPWLFYELSPEYTWPVTLSEDRQTVLIDRRSKWRIFFRLEIHFGNATRKRYSDYY
jgi:hypothetical protein